MKGVISIKLIVCTPPKESKALLQAIRPDDKSSPPWLKIREEATKEGLVIEVEAPLERIRSARNTIDEIIEFLYAALKSLEQVSLDAKKIKEEEELSGSVAE